MCTAVVRSGMVLCLTKKTTARLCAKSCPRYLSLGRVCPRRSLLIHGRASTRWHRIGTWTEVGVKGVMSMTDGDQTRRGWYRRVPVGRCLTRGLFALPGCVEGMSSRFVVAAATPAYAAGERLG